MYKVEFGRELAPGMQNPLIDSDALVARLQDPKLAIVDCRFDLMNPTAGREAWLQDHIPGAVFADLDRDLAGPVTATSGRHPLPDASEFAETLGQLGIDRDSDVVVYDDASGAIAARAWWMLRWLGHERVALLETGFAGWLAKGRPTESRAVQKSTKTFCANVHDDRVLSTDDIVRRRTMTLVDARDARRFRGEVEPIDSVAGHIPLALNLPFSDTIDSGGRFKNVDELALIWQERLGVPPGDEWAVMCGSGVTACHLALSGLLAGYCEPQLYVGSWSEWIRDPARPIATTD